MINLDDQQIYKKYDPQGMLAHIYNLPQMCRRAWRMAAEFKLPEYKDIDKIVVAGMGGSAIGGDIAASLVADESKIPVLVHRGYDLPAFVDEKTLVVASSYSGMTEETLSAFRQALDTGANNLVITTGGELKTLAEENNIPVFCFDYVCQPRAALPFSLLPLLNFLQRLGIIEAKDDDVAEAVAVLEKLSSEVNETVAIDTNKAKQLAQALHGKPHEKMAVIYGAGITAAVAMRWKTQINENSKAWSFYEISPELNHNSIVGYSFPKIIPPNTSIVILKSKLQRDSIHRRFDIISQLLYKAKISYYQLEGWGRGALAQVMSLVLFGDYVSYYLAILNQIDPTPVEAIDFLKGELGKK